MRIQQRSSLITLLAQSGMIARIKRQWRIMRGHWWFIRTFKVIDGAQFLALQQERAREVEEGFNPETHGERMLRAMGATEEQIAEAYAKGWA